ncbi:MerR family transcriptional regulator [Acutalibacter sp. 1XD8-36]|uniref:MerR family transcriptional regulator n=1 Tax=Acutalibacter sp. 1XD8-36 TaxID=2320852 RepID=UPI001413660F|nr:MerR family transcriptional regulator [Acutalibacter sp. 1XD8-36]
MEKFRAVPQGYLTVGEVAKRMDVTVRTLQHYDKEGLLSPSALSEGGRRLYTDKDIVKLHQILSLKHLGFSLNDIRDRLIPLDDPADVAQILSEQAATMRNKIANLTESLSEIEALKTEVLEMQTVDFKKYADIIVNLEMKNDFYWLIKHFDGETLDHIRSRFDKKSGIAFLQRFLHLQDEAIRLQDEGILADSTEGLQFAKAYWDMISEFTSGDATMLPKLMQMGENEELNQEWRQKQAQANAFIEPALGAYFSNSGINPFQEETT